MQFTLQQIADLLNGRVEGDPDATVSTIAPIEKGKPGALSFLANPKYEPHIYSTASTAVLVNESFIPATELSCSLIRVHDPYLALSHLLSYYDRFNASRSGIEQPAYIAPDAIVPESAFVGAFSYIGAGAILEDGVQIYPQVYLGEHVKVGKGSVLFPGVKVYHGCIIGEHCTIHSGAVIGSDGFGFAPADANDYKKVPQIGNVVLENQVEVGSNTTIDRATLGSTIIRRGTKLDNLIQIAHNVDLGAHSVVAAQSGIAGSTSIGDHAMIGGQVGIIGHLQLAANIKIAAQSGVGHSVPQQGAVLQGSPAFSIGDYQKSYVYFRKLPQLAARLDALEKKLKELGH